MKQESEPKPRRRRPSKLGPFKSYLKSRLERFDLPATVLLREIRKKGYLSLGETAEPLNPVTTFLT